MDSNLLSHLISTKLNDGGLPQDSIPRLWGGPGNGETCQACDETVLKGQLMMEGIGKDGGKGVQFHVKCFYLWDSLRIVEGHRASEPA